MARLAYSKASLSKESTKLKRYQHYLPSLDLKRQQLALEYKKAQAQLSKTGLDIKRCLEQTAVMLPMLADKSIHVQGLVKVVQIDIIEENVVGVHLPLLKQLDFQVARYSLFTEPHWVDQLVMQLKKTIKLKIQHQIDMQRVDALSLAVKKVTQRVNLFDKVLIPKAQEDIRKIRTYLSDMEIAGVVRAKSTKQKRMNMSKE